MKKPLPLLRCRSLSELSSAVDPSAGVGGRRRSTEAALARAVDASFADKLRGCEGDVAATLYHGEALVDELTATLDDVAYCHPPRPEIAAFYAGEYQARLYDAIAAFLADAALEALGADEILKLVAWVYNYHDRLLKLNVPLTHSLADVPAFRQLLAYVPTCEGHMKKMIPRAKIKAVKAEEPGVSMPCAQCPRASNCDMMDEFHFSLPQLVGARREALLKPSAAASGPSGVKGPALWGQADEATAECQILSFAACSHLSAKTRRRALRTQDTTERLTLASGELRERQLEMCAELALRAAFP